MSASKAGAGPPRVSVITIFYNAEAHLREAVATVLAQDFGDFELLLVDDGSTDSGTFIARDFSALDDRVHYLDHPGHANRGMSAARNLGLSEARGEFVAFIDSDDRWGAAKLSEQVALLERMPEVDVVGGTVNYWKSHEGGADRMVPTAHVRYRHIPPGEATVTLYPLGRATAPSMSDLMFRRSAIEAVGGFEETFVGAYEDQAFLAKIYLGSTLYITDDHWSDYRIHAKSCMAKVALDGSYNDVRRVFLSWFDDYLSGHALYEDQHIRGALNRARRRFPSESGIMGLRQRLRAVAPRFVVQAVRSARRGIEGLRSILAPGPAILMYHRIADDPIDPWGLSVSPAYFKDQVEWLKRERTILPVAQFAAMKRDGVLPRNAVALTFDDGYACNAAVAVPILERFEAPATIFISPELAEAQHEFWWDELMRIIYDAEPDRLILEGRPIYLGSILPADHRWAFADPPATPRQRAYRRLWLSLYEFGSDRRTVALADLRAQSGISAQPRDSHRLMTAQEIKSVRSSLIDFGSHALSHPSLPQLTKEEQALEIVESRARCAELTGSDCRSFAYPFGDFDTTSRNLVEQAGFDCACKTGGWFVRPSSDLFALPRIHVGNWPAGLLAHIIGRA